MPIDDPSRDELLVLESSVAHAIVALLEKRGILAEGEIVFDDDMTGALDRCRTAAVTGRIAFGPLAGSPAEREGAYEPGPGSGSPRRKHGFDLFLEPPVQDRSRLEKLCRYLARPPIAEGRLAWCDDGRVRLELPRPWANGTTAVILDPLEGRSIPRRRKGRTSGGSWIPWSELMKRTFHLDLLRCPCGGRREVVAFITRPDAIRDILECLGLPAEPPQVAPSWWGRGQLIWN